MQWAERQHQETQQPGGRSVWEISEDLVEARRHGGETALAAIRHQREIGVLAALVLPAFEHRGQEIELAQNIGEPLRDHFLALERAAQGEQRHVDRERERRGVAAELFVVGGRLASLGSGRKCAAGPSAAPGAERVYDRVADVTPERLVECIESARMV